MKLNTLKPAAGARTERTRVGRGIGSGLGKTAGRGHKGSFARAGKGKIKAGFEGGQMPMHMRIPKMRGFQNPFRVSYQVVNLAKLGELFPEGGEIGVDDLVAKGAVRAGKLVKVLGNGELSVKLNVTADAFAARFAGAAFVLARGAASSCATFAAMKSRT